jgi:2-methylcitrate dehydratase
MRGEMGYPGALSTRTWGFEDVVLRGKRLAIPAQGFGSYVMENVLFKISYPAEFHAQTAVEAAVALQPEVAPRLGEVERVVIETQESGQRIIDKTGRLSNPADRDHCLQYMVAVGLIKGSLAAGDYEDAAAADPRIDALRDRMEVVENPAFSRDYLDPGKRSIANAVQVFFRGGASTRRVEVEYPLGHRRRRQEGAPLLRAKFEAAVRGHFTPSRAGPIIAHFANPAGLDSLTVAEFMGLFVP